MSMNHVTENPFAFATSIHEKIAKYFPEASASTEAQAQTSVNHTMSYHLETQYALTEELEYNTNLIDR
jgi:hypothetical protein